MGSRCAGKAHQLLHREGVHMSPSARLELGDRLPHGRFRIPQLSEKVRRRVDRRDAVREHDEGEVIARCRVFPIPAARPGFHETVVTIHRGRGLHSVGQIQFLSLSDRTADDDELDPRVRQTQFGIFFAVVMIEKVVNRHHSDFARARHEGHEGPHLFRIDAAIVLPPTRLCEPHQMPGRIFARREALQFLRRRRFPHRGQTRKLNMFQIRPPEARVTRAKFVRQFPDDAAHILRLHLVVQTGAADDERPGAVQQFGPVFDVS
mmetsp:Transcript_34949/g.80823  ORF Transcript_34949/g.80823 Transcript_34949/m.80823 type:complete len:263 (-) Transcript_34949:360-1148(-)